MNNLSLCFASVCVNSWENGFLTAKFSTPVANFICHLVPARWCSVTFRSTTARCHFLWWDKKVCWFYDEPHWWRCKEIALIPSHPHCTQHFTSLGFRNLHWRQLKFTDNLLLVGLNQLTPPNVFRFPTQWRLVWSSSAAHSPTICAGCFVCWCHNLVHIKTIYERCNFPNHDFRWCSLASFSCNVHVWACSLVLVFFH